MSITVEYFFNYSETLGVTSDLVNQTIGSSLSPYEGDANDLYCRFLGMELGLAETEFENDGDLNFEDYRYYLNFRTSVGAALLREMQVPAMALIAYALRCAKSIGGMLVYDGQVLLARYEERSDPQVQEPRLFDTVSNSFVIFPDHLVALDSRLPDGFLPFHAERA